jgi:hypothetical protein
MPGLVCALLALALQSTGLVLHLWSVVGPARCAVCVDGSRAAAFVVAPALVPADRPDPSKPGHDPLACEICRRWTTQRAPDGLPSPPATVRIERVEFLPAAPVPPVRSLAARHTALPRGPPALRDVAHPAA